VEIARALALHPRLLLLDEPTAGMNESETAEMAAIIGQLKTEGRSILLIEHKLDLVMRLSDRVIAMDDGLVIAEGPPATVRADPAVIDDDQRRRYYRLTEEGRAVAVAEATRMEKLLERAKGKRLFRAFKQA